MRRVLVLILMVMVMVMIVRDGFVVVVGFEVLEYESSVPIV
jgi:hypothetical protein